MTKLKTMMQKNWQQEIEIENNGEEIENNGDDDEEKVTEDEE